MKACSSNEVELMNEYLSYNLEANREASLPPPHPTRPPHPSPTFGAFGAKQSFYWLLLTFCKPCLALCSYMAS